MPSESGAWLGDSFRSLKVLTDRAHALAAMLPGLDRNGQRTVVSLARNSFLPLEVTMAAARAGFRVVPVSSHATSPELKYLVEDSGADIVVGDADLLAPMRDVIEARSVIAQRTPNDVAAAYTVAEQLRATPAWCADYDEVLEGAAADTPAESGRRESSLSSLFYTSGTTGKPKGVVRETATPEQIERRQRALETCYGLRPDSVGIVTTPLCHMFASNFAQTSLRLGGTVVIMPRFDAAEFLELVQRHQVTNTQLVPTMLVRLLRLSEADRSTFDLSTLCHVLHTGAPCPDDVKRRVIDWLGPIVWEQYGSTETGVVALCDTEQWLAHPGTVGRSFNGSEIGVYADDGSRCPPGVVGEIYARMHGTPDFTYLGRSEARAAIERDGLVSAGDIGELDTDGFLYLRDRRQDMIVTGGNNVYPAEVEAVLGEHPLVSDCAVFGIPDDEFGQRVVAVVSVRAGATLNADTDLDAYLRDRVAGYKVPRTICVVDQVPRNDSGKLLRRLARDNFTSALQTTVS